MTHFEEIVYIHLLIAVRKGVMGWQALK